MWKNHIRHTLLVKRGKIYSPVIPSPFAGFGSVIKSYLSHCISVPSGSACVSRADSPFDLLVYCVLKKLVCQCCFPTFITVFRALSIWLSTLSAPKPKPTIMTQMMHFTYLRNSAHKNSYSLLQKKAPLIQS